MGIVTVRLACLQLLDRSTSHRLGCRPNGQGFVDLQQHPWFTSINWDALEAKESQPPFVPDVCYFFPSSIPYLTHF
jgi:serine/threonine kinase 32